MSCSTCNRLGAKLQWNDYATDLLLWSRTYMYHVKVGRANRQRTTEPIEQSLHRVELSPALVAAATTATVTDHPYPLNASTAAARGVHPPTTPGVTSQSSITLSYFCSFFLFTYSLFSSPFFPFHPLFPEILHNNILLVYGQCRWLCFVDWSVKNPSFS